MPFFPTPRHVSTPTRTCDAREVAGPKAVLVTLGVRDFKALHPFEVDNDIVLAEAWRAILRKTEMQ